MWEKKRGSFKCSLVVVMELRQVACRVARACLELASRSCGCLRQAVFMRHTKRSSHGWRLRWRCYFFLFFSRLRATDHSRRKYTHSRK